MPDAKRLIFGLGNPGAEYHGTRHNVGFAVADVLAERAGVTLQRDRSNAMLGIGRSRGRSFVLAKPLTYMNRSGAPFHNIARRFGLRLEDTLVIVDDINLPLGAVRVRQGGSAGGHNGVQDIIDQVKSDAFPRIRIGIGNDFSRGRQADYVLSRFKSEEEPLIQEAIALAAEAATTFIVEGLVTAMNRYNRK